MIIDDLIPEYCTAEKLPGYIRNRLHNDTEAAPPPVSSYHGVEAVEDMLFTLYHEPEFPAELIPCFWHELAQVAQQAWYAADTAVYARVAHLCVRLEKPGDNIEPWAFLPQMETDFDWTGDDDKIRLYTLGIWQLYTWKTRQPAFWSEVFQGLYKVCSAPNAQADFEKLYGVLRHVWVAIEQPTAEQWLDLFRLFLVRNGEADEFLGLCMDGKWGACRKDQACETALVKNVKSALTLLRASGNFLLFENKKEKALRKIISDWSKLPWYISATQVQHELQSKLTVGSRPGATAPVPRSASPNGRRAIRLPKHPVQRSAESRI